LATSLKVDELSNPGGDAPEHFRTDHLLEDIGTRAISAGFVTVGAQAAKFLLNFMAATILARLLSPSEFGLTGMVLGVTSLVGVFNAMGLSTATIQRETITEKQVSNLFWTNIGSSGILTLLCAASAPLFARFYHNEHVASIMLVLSFTFVLTGSTVQHQALLTRQMMPELIRELTYPRSQRTLAGRSVDQFRRRQRKRTEPVVVFKEAARATGLFV
jgi:PST family polysaccharide transporter